MATRLPPLAFLVTLAACDPYAGFTEPHGSDCIRFDSWDRCWESHVPPGLVEAPLVIDMHGWLGTPEGQRENSKLDALADTEGFVAVWPHGLGRSWNAGPGCCDPAEYDTVDDVGFLRELVGRVIEQHPVDADRVYVTGLSNGCAMTQRFVLEASDLVAAGACMAMVRLVDRPNTYGAVPFMALHGTDDDVVPYDGEEFPGALENIARWADDNLCEANPETTWSDGDSAALSWLDCANDSEVSLATIAGGGHILYGGEDTDLDTTVLAWEFLSRFSR